MRARILRTKRKLSEYIIVVSGLPRSGTSMMMRMLEAGGMEVVTDHTRKADDDNPYGYYELEKVKKLKEDSSFLETAYGKVVKIISLLLYDLPKSKNYKIIFMRRDIEEILASQRTMLLRKQKSADLDNDKDMRRIFDKHLYEIYLWTQSQENIDIIYVDYNDVIKYPLESAKTVNKLLENCLDAQRMAEAVDERLYRERVFHD